MPIARRPQVDQNNGVSGLGRRYAGTDLEHLRRRLVAEQMGQELVRPFRSLDLVDLSSADRRIEHLHQHLPGVELFRKHDLVDHQRLARLRKDRGFSCPDLHCPRPRHSK